MYSEVGNLQRAMHLLEQKKYDYAEKEFRLLISKDFNDPFLYSYLAYCLLLQKRIKEALEEAKKAIGFGPDLPHVHFIASLIYLEEENFRSAEKHIKEALRLDPSESEYYYILGSIYFNRSQWKEALEAAENGLQQNAENINNLNLRARCLNRLGEKDLATDTFSTSFRKDANNPDTHANQGWVSLEQGDPKKALVHFREALRLQPTNAFAKQGLVEALKARYLLYKWFLGFSFWLQNLSSGARWAVIIGLVVIANVVPGLAPFYLIFVMFTWMADQLFNSLLRINKYGKHALSEKETQASNFFIALFTGGVVSIVLSYVIAFPSLLVVGLVFLGWLFPLSGYYRATYKKTKRTRMWYGLALVVVGLAFIGAEFMSLQQAGMLSSVFIYGTVGYTWLTATQQG